MARRLVEWGMARKLRLEYPGAIYHVKVKGSVPSNVVLTDGGLWLSGAWPENCAWNIRGRYIT
jgi:hypothetical protein